MSNIHHLRKHRCTIAHRGVMCRLCELTFSRADRMFKIHYPKAHGIVREPGKPLSEEVLEALGASEYEKYILTTPLRILFPSNLNSAESMTSSAPKIDSSMTDITSLSPKDYLPMLDEKGDYILGNIYGLYQGMDYGAVPRS